MNIYIYTHILTWYQLLKYVYVCFVVDKLTPKLLSYLHLLCNGVVPFCQAGIVVGGAQQTVLGPCFLLDDLGWPQCAKGNPLGKPGCLLSCSTVWPEKTGNKYWPAKKCIGDVCNLRFAMFTDRLPQCPHRIPNKDIKIQSFPNASHSTCCAG